MPLGHMTLKYTVIGSRAFAACACCINKHEKYFKTKTFAKSVSFLLLIKNYNFFPMIHFQHGDLHDQVEIF